MHVLVNQNHEPVFGKSAAVSIRDGFRGADIAGDATGLSIRVGHNVREHHEVFAMLVLQQVLAAKPDGADVETAETEDR
ncbi:hypothetical protein AT728_35635 [Streptomyces silvensis]|uniref:Uncharacterized protein n=1 Tax=Streptomyces silvensis TaxID=1765722 RepID=A0A0W7WW49_9ACTN|nr:hypothetical protein AT728_35635 [Streptomyces silvensis]